VVNLEGEDKQGEEPSGEKGEDDAGKKKGDDGAETKKSSELQVFTDPLPRCFVRSFRGGRFWALNEGATSSY